MSTTINAETNEISIFRRNINKGIKANILSLNNDESRITYYCSRIYSTSFKNPEETVRASYFVELVLDYLYPKERIDFEVATKPDKDRIDILVFEDDELKAPFLIVENKKDGISDSEFKQACEQAFRYANYKKAHFATVVAGMTKKTYNTKDYKSGEREKNVVSDIPTKYGKVPKYKFKKGDPQKELKEVSREELIKALEKSHNTVWQGGKLAPTTAFDEVSKLLFCKLTDEKDTFLNKPYQFQIGTHETPKDVFDRISGIYDKAKLKDSEVFKQNINLAPEIVYSVVEHLQEIAFVKVDLDTKGVAFERFMQDFFKGKMGQYFTPRTPVEFAVKMLNPQPHHLILDPACGSGGFLLNCLDFIRRFCEAHYTPIEAKEHWHRFAKNNLYGIEINDQIARVCKMNMIIHDDGHTNVISTDGLNSFEAITNLHPKFKANIFDLIFTNPPFGASIKSAEKQYMKNYDLGKNKSKVRKTQKSEILFIERCIHFLKPEFGRMAIILPDGILTNSSLQYTRNFLLQYTQILAVVSLPQFAFAHYGAGVKSSLVFVRRLGINEKMGNYPIFMAIAENIGYDATGRTTKENDLSEILNQFREFQEKHF